jgi:2'-5' RNA ligase
MQAGDRLICAFVAQQRIGTTFNDWFLHVTIVPWFRLDDSSEWVAQGLEQALEPIEPFEVTMGDDAAFGPHHDRPAVMVQHPTPFVDIERRIRNYFHKKQAWLVDETTKIRYEFRPHVTAQKAGQLHSGDAFECDRLYIVEQKGDYKEIVEEVIFNG